jgi:hypothetical protein
MAGKMPSGLLDLTRFIPNITISSVLAHHCARSRTSEVIAGASNVISKSIRDLDSLYIAPGAYAATYGRKEEEAFGSSGFYKVSYPI